MPPTSTGSSTGTSTGSYQLPDILSLFQDYHEMTVNKHCRVASLASEEWIRGLGFLTLFPSPELTSMKLGLLGSCCFPSCDLNQLTLIIDFWTILVLDTHAVLRSDPPTRCGWDLVIENPDIGFVDLLQAHPLFKELLPRLVKFRDNTSEWWQKRFSRSIAAYRSSQQKAISYRQAGNVPPLGIEEYIVFRRDISGLHILLDLIEAVECLDLDTPMHNEQLRTMRHLAADIVVLTWDVFSYNIDQSLGNKINVVTMLQSNRSVGLTHCINEAGTLIQQKLEQFRSIEDNLNPKATSASTNSAFLSWLWNTQKVPDSNLPSSAQVHDVELYIRQLKDCMVGFINWAYETDMFFKTKGESVKSFGWVFLLPSNSRNDEPSNQIDA